MSRWRHIGSSRTRVAIFAAALVALAAGCGGGSSSSAPLPVTQTVVRTSTVVQAPKKLSFTALVAKVKSGIVRIETTACGERFVGTGFLVGPHLIATVEHVVDGAQTITLKQDGKIVGSGTVIGADQPRDVALVRSNRAISGYRFHLNPRSPALGQDVSALGFPFGLPLTVTRGSVSGLNRTIPISGISRRSLVQTDAPVNPGNSGGPLMTDSGQVVGLVDIGTNQANGLAFAVSARVAGPLIAGWEAAPQAVSAVSCGAPSTPTVAAAPPPSSSATDRKTAVSTAVYTYWSLLQLNDYAKAFTWLSPAEQTRVGGRGKFLSYFRDDPVISVNVRVAVRSMSGSAATVDVVALRTQGAATGCRDWTGSYQLVRSGNRWLIDYANLRYTAC